MKRSVLIGIFALAAIAGTPTPASADITFFLGFSPTPESRGVRGVAAGVSMLIVGFEFEYANTSAKEAVQAPGVRTGMFNALVMTPTKTQLYVTAGAGFFREKLGDLTTNSWGTNIGGGVKFGLVGRLQGRVDYRVFSFRGTPLHKTPQRFYAGLNLSF
jgi:hypothetical protein